MRYLKYLALLAILAVPAIYAQAQVSIGVQIGPDYGIYNAPPVCTYGYYSYYPFDCAPYGYWGPEWFVDGVFIGAGPWDHFYFRHPEIYERVYGFRRFHDFDRFRDRDDRFRGDRFRGGAAVRVEPFRGNRGESFHDNRGFRADNGGFRGRETFRGNSGGGFRGRETFHGNSGGGFRSGGGHSNGHGGDHGGRH